MIEIPDEPPENPMRGLTESWDESREGRSKLDRLVEVATTLHEPSRVSEVADRADCSSNFARDKLRLLTSLGVLERVSSEPATYRRDETHFRRLRTKALLEEADQDVTDLIEQYRERDQELQKHFGVDSPAAVSYEHLDSVDDPDILATESEKLATWQRVRDRLLDLQRAKAMDVASQSAARPGNIAGPDTDSTDGETLTDL